tara:strand:+ start:3165 stop:4022 length:858 start_codon:yes stop_codon:yes gene_type:complete
MIFSEHQAQIFLEATGHELWKLCDEISSLDELQRKEVEGLDKHIFNHPLNKKGLQAFRALLAENTWIQDLKNSNNYDNQNTQAFIENGYFIKEDFMPLELYEQIQNLSHGVHNMGTELVELYKQVLTFAGSRFDFSYKNINIKTYEHFEGDDQYELHLDSHRPRIKSWVYLQDTTEEHGPLGYVPKSNKNTVEKLKWLYETSLIANDEKHPLFFNRHISTPRVGSYRLNRQADANAELERLNMAKEKVMCVKENTLVVADTRGFHRRVPAEPGTKRKSMRFNILL